MASISEHIWHTACKIGEPEFLLKHSAEDKPTYTMHIGDITLFGHPEDFRRLRDNISKVFTDD